MKIQIGKFFTIAVIVIFTGIGLVLIFLDMPVERIDALVKLIGAMFPYILPILAGVSIGGVIKKAKKK